MPRWGLLHDLFAALNVNLPMSMMPLPRLVPCPGNVHPDVERSQDAGAAVTVPTSDIPAAAPRTRASNDDPHEGLQRRPSPG